MNKDLVTYYKNRAKEYENIYLKPERQVDLATATHILQENFIDKKVFEIGCGTGYWTEKIAKTATSIFAIDINETVLDIAKHKVYDNTPVSFAVADFYSYQPDEKYEGLLANFIWSHIQLQDLDKFLDKIAGCVLPDAPIVFMDNNYVEGSSTAIIETDEQGNSFQTRILSDGSEHRIRKNFPSENFVVEKLKSIGADIEFINLTYFWIAIVKTIRPTL